jgi:hypothetical protein
VQKLVDDKKAKAEAKAKAAYEQEWRDQLVARTWDVMQRSDDIVMAFNTEVHRYVALKVANNLSTDQSVKVGKVLGLDKVGSHSALLDHIKTSEQPDAIHLLMILVCDSSANDFSYSDRIANEGMHLVAGIVHGGGLKSTLKDIQAEALAKHFPKVKEEKAKVATGSAARPKEGAGGTKGEVSASKKPPARAAKLSAEEATLGIADALQGIEGAASADAVALPAKPAGAPYVVKYRDPLTHQTWTGRGLKPRWVALHLEAGGSMDDLLVTAEREDAALLTSAEQLVVREQKANIRLLKSELNVGTSKALELMDRLEQAGKVSACDERGARKVLVAA